MGDQGSGGVKGRFSEEGDGEGSGRSDDPSTGGDFGSDPLTPALRTVASVFSTVGFSQSGRR